MNITRKINFDEFVKNLPAVFADIADRNEVVIVESESGQIKLESAEQTATNPGVRTPLTDDEVVTGLKALQNLRALRNQMLHQHGDEPFAESWEDIRKDRE